jgi:hypothetical protein
MESDTKNTPMTDEPRARRDAARDLASVLHIRTTDVEPFTGLRYLSKLFKVMAVILALLIVSEVVTGLVTQGSAAIPMLLNEVSRLLVFTGLLWGAGDLAILLIDVGHDVRAARIMMSRLAPQPGEAAEEEVIISRPGERAHDIPRVTESPARPMRPADPHANPE